MCVIRSKRLAALLSQNKQQKWWIPYRLIIRNWQDIVIWFMRIMYHCQAMVEFANLATKRKNLLTYPASATLIYLQCNFCILYSFTVLRENQSCRSNFWLKRNLTFLLLDSFQGHTHIDRLSYSHNFTLPGAPRCDKENNTDKDQTGTKEFR